MKRVSEFEQNIVGGVDDIVYGPYARALQSCLKPVRGLRDFNPLDDTAGIPRTEVLVDYFDVKLGERFVMYRMSGRLEGLSGYGMEFTGYAQDA